MRLLLDESLSARLVVPLDESGHDVVHLGDLGLLGASDEVVLAAAVEHNRTLITADTDFGALLAISGASLPSVVLLRRGGRTQAERAWQISIVLEATSAALESGALVVAEPTRARIRPLPMGRSPE